MAETSGTGCRVTFGSKRVGRLVCGSLGILPAAWMGVQGMQPNLTHRYTNARVGSQTNLTQLLQMVVFCEGISAYMISLFSFFFVFPLSFLYMYIFLYYIYLC